MTMCDMAARPVKRRPFPAALGINSVTITKPKYADKALRRLDAAVDFFNAARTTYGALQNRLEHSVANNENTGENLLASESVLRDAEMGFELVAYHKNNILVKSAQAVLAQANWKSNGVLSLLQ